MAQARSKGHDTANNVSQDGQPRARHGPRHGRPARRASSARTRGLGRLEVSRDIIVCIVDGGDLLGRDTISAERARVVIQILYRDQKEPATQCCVATQCCDITGHAPRHGRGGCDTARSSVCGCVATRLYGARHRAQHGRCALRHGHDTAGGRPRYGLGEATTRRLVCHNMAGPARSLGLGCASYGPNPVLT